MYVRSRWQLVTSSWNARLTWNRWISSIRSCLRRFLSWGQLRRRKTVRISRISWRAWRGRSLVRWMLHSVILLKCSRWSEIELILKNRRPHCMKMGLYPTNSLSLSTLTAKETNTNVLRAISWTRKPRPQSVTRDKPLTMRQWISRLATISTSRHPSSTLVNLTERVCEPIARWSAFLLGTTRR